MTPIFIDFETFYDKEYTLKKLTMEEYIRDQRFECIGLSIKVGNTQTQFYPREQGLDILRQHLVDTPDHTLISHNAYFDMGILGLRYDIHPKMMGDTMLMSSVCGLDRCAGGGSLDKLSTYLQSIGYNMPSKGDYVHNMLGVRADSMGQADWISYGMYCKTDTDICAAIYQIIVGTVPHDEMRMISTTLKMFTNPIVELNTDLLVDYKERLIQKRHDLLKDVANRLGFSGIDELGTHLRSTAKFAKLLESIGVPVPMKYSEKQDKMIPAVSKTDQEFLDLKDRGSELVQALCEARLGAASNLEMTRCDRFIAVSERGRLPIPLRYASAHTGRYGGSDKVNLQNLPKRKGDTSLRRAMTAPAGHVLIATDSSQIEARLLSSIANERRMVDIFVNKLDPYSDMAAKIYGMTYEQVYDEAKVNKTKQGTMRRNVGKTTILGAGFGMGGTKFRDQLLLDGLNEAADMADTIISTYRSSNPNIVNFWRTCGTALEVMLTGGNMWFGGESNDLFYADGSSVFWGKRIPSIRMPNGTYIWYQNLRKVPRQEPSSFGDGMEFVYDQFKSRVYVPNRVYGGKVAENLTQALAFAVLKYQALQMVDMGIPVHMNVHDEWVSIVPKSMAAHAVRAHAKAMRSVPDYIPQGLLDMELDMGKNYADTTTIGGL